MSYENLLERANKIILQESINQGFLAKLTKLTREDEEEEEANLKGKKVETRRREEKKPVERRWKDPRRREGKIRGEKN